MYKKISALKLASQFVSDFGLTGPKIQDNVRKKIERVCQEIPAPDDNGTNLWSASAIEYVDKETGDKTYRHFFSKADIERMLQDENFVWYLHKRASGHGKTLLQKKLVLINETKERPSKHETVPEEYYGATNDLTADIRSHEMYVMIKALFLQHFEPIDGDGVPHGPVRLSGTAYRPKNH